MEPASEPGSNRRTTILEASIQVFMRYGYRKTSMDDLARAAGLSRQGLYLHFTNKEDLFRAAVTQVIEQGRQSYRAALALAKTSLEERLLAAFQAFHGCHIGQISEQYIGEIMEAATRFLGSAPADNDRLFIEDVVAQLPKSRGGGSDPREVAEILFSTSYGMKHRVASPEVYRARMAAAIRLVLGGAGRGQKT